MARRVALPQSKLKKKRRARRVQLGVVVAVIFLILVGGIVGALWLPQIRIQTVTVSDTKTLAPGSVESFIKDLLSNRILYVFPADNIFIYPKATIENALLAAYPTLAGASIRTDGFAAIQVSLEERAPSALWCGSAPEAGSPCALMDANGLAYAPAADFSQSDYFVYYGPASTTSGFDGNFAPKQFLNPADFHALASLAQALAKNQQGVRVSRVAVDELGDARLTFENGFSIIFALKDATGDVYERFTLALQTDAFVSHPISDFEYLDLRFGDKLYYHLKTK